MLKQKVKIIENGNIITTNISSAKNIVSTGKGYLIGDPFEFTEQVVAPVEDTDTEIDDI